MEDLIFESPEKSILDIIPQEQELEVEVEDVIENEDVFEFEEEPKIQTRRVRQRYLSHNSVHHFEVDEIEAR
jgi:hypothetical protein